MRRSVVVALCFAAVVVTLWLVWRRSAEDSPPQSAQDNSEAETLGNQTSKMEKPECSIFVCGDGVVCGDEVCDDGNTDDCAGACSADCSKVTGCGDGVVCGGETCDDGGESATCDADCTPVKCGDGSRNASAGEDRACESWVTIPGGTFMMGSTGRSSEQPIHEVTVSSFQMMTTAVTVGDYRACVDSEKCTAPDAAKDCNWSVGGRNDHPVNCVDWNQATAYCTWAGGRLPSEVEWEYAARGGGRDVAYPWGDERATCDYAVMARGCGQGRTWPVCSKSAGNSGHGLCDMAGNVWEWVQDSYHTTYNGAPADGSAWEDVDGSSRMVRVQRGGCWVNYGKALGAARRHTMGPDIKSPYVGIRCVRPKP